MKDAAPGPNLFDTLERDPHRFEALTALRLAAAEAERRGVPLDIKSAPSTALASSAIRAVNVRADRIEVDCALTGLVGPLSPLPPAYTELAAADTRRRAGGLSGFLEIFSDRMARLFEAAAAKYSLPALLQWQRDDRNRILTALNGLIGAAPPGLQKALPLPAQATLRHAGLLSQRTRSAVGLRTLVEAELGLPVRVVQFQHRWRMLDEEDQTQLDGSRVLGVDSVAGGAVPNRSGQVRLIIGPVRYADFLTLEAGQPRLIECAKLVQFYLGPVIEFDLQIVLDKRDVPETQLGGSGPAVRLGWNAWARTEPAARDSDEAIIDGALAQLERRVAA
ncbi:type VI secretion system baseplate subunit TssG [Thalassococcus sp. S3]|uniref:type VI secretion system baseplate subunit TssG n=1 Tax=Thalassococcus sp. S3 TaxID=2017482 RepID=UPI00102464E2|nr:type VI secretion system baseplate subunit TssG [Thalassococcus sp. S3]QBF32477.1 hypothetical protein CFI11_14815 [Thalassococcus sp. S3]